MSILRPLSSWSLPSIAVLVFLFLAGCSPSSPEPGAGQAADKQKEALCKHEVAEKFCPICHPEVLKDPNILLCKEHGNIPEDICTACHPELKAKYKTCEHELPPALCTSCQKKGAPPGGSK